MTITIERGNLKGTHTVEHTTDRNNDKYDSVITATINGNKIIYVRNFDMTRQLFINGRENKNFKLLEL